MWLIFNFTSEQWLLSGVPRYHTRLMSSIYLAYEVLNPLSIYFCLFFQMASLMTIGEGWIDGPVSWEKQRFTADRIPIIWLNSCSIILSLVNMTQMLELSHRVTLERTLHLFPVENHGLLMGICLVSQMLHTCLRTATVHAEGQPFKMQIESRCLQKAETRQWFSNEHFFYTICTSRPC